MCVIVYNTRERLMQSSTDVD